MGVAGAVANGDLGPLDFALVIAGLSRPRPISVADITCQPLGVLADLVQQTRDRKADAKEVKAGFGAWDAVRSDRCDMADERLKIGTVAGGRQNRVRIHPCSVSQHNGPAVKCRNARHDLNASAAYGIDEADIENWHRGSASEL